MSRWRIVVLLLLIAAPLLILAGIGSYALWQTGWGLYAWWPMAACMTLGYLLGWYWQRRRQLLPPVDFTPPPHWTERDRRAWQLVEARAKATAQLDPAHMGELQFYVDTARELALELARFYHPNVSDPIGAATVPELLAVIELAAHDLAEQVDHYLPAGHLLTIDHWRQAKKAAEKTTVYYQSFNKLYWLISAVFSPVSTGMRYSAAQLGMARPWQLLQQNLIAWFYTLYVHRLGNYLIDLNSGRLRVGARRYTELLRDGQAVTPAAPTVDAAEQVRGITLLLLGQVKAGKSSFINAVLGERRAATDVLPATAHIRRYELQPTGIPTRLVFLDTPGYARGGPDDAELLATEEAARQADLLLLVTHALNPARQDDLVLLQKLRHWFAERPELRMPPILAVMTHIDLLSPALEWSPPYDWRSPTRPKEHAILDAFTALREQLGDHLVGIVPVCAAPGKVYGIDEWFLPTLTELLDEAHAVALLRCLRAETDTGQVRKVFQQLVEAGKQAAQLVWESYRK